MHSNSQHRLPRARAPLCFILFDVTKSLCHLLWAEISKLILRFVSKRVLRLKNTSKHAIHLLCLPWHPGWSSQDAHLPECDGVPGATACGGAPPTGAVDVAAHILERGYISLEGGAFFGNSSAGKKCLLIILTVISHTQAIALYIQEVKQQTVDYGIANAIFRVVSWAMSLLTMVNNSS